MSRTKKAPARIRSRRRRVLLALEVTGIIALVLAAAALWPVQLGGSSSVIIVHGVSMQPTLDNGDVVVLRSASTYHVGDIVAYRVPAGNAGAGNLIIHRIVDVSPRGFVMRGDHRATNDAWFPSGHDIVGRVVLHVPLLGEGLWTLLPWLFGAVLGLGLILYFWSPREIEAVQIAEVESSPAGPVAPPALATVVPQSVPDRWAAPNPHDRVTEKIDAIDLDRFLRRLFEHESESTKR